MSIKSSHFLLLLSSIATWAKCLHGVSLKSVHLSPCGHRGHLSLCAVSMLLILSLLYLKMASDYCAVIGVFTSSHSLFACVPSILFLFPSKYLEEFQ